MDGNSDQIIPRARERGLIVRELDEETVVYDLEHDTAHCLNGVAARVWRHCDGQTTVGDMVDILRDSAETPVGEDSVWSALSELGRYNLLEEQVSRAAARTMSRRDLIHRAGVTVGVGVPLITSLSILTAQAAGASCRSAVQSCVTGACCPGLTCGPRSTCCIPNGNGQVCTNDLQCCSGHCHRTTGDLDSHCTS